MTARVRTLQGVIASLQAYWSARGCLIHQPWDAEVGAGTMHPETFLRVLGPKPWKVAYVQPSRRPADGRYGENPNRLYKHLQLQVILKPAPADVFWWRASVIVPAAADRAAIRTAGARRTARLEIMSLVRRAEASASAELHPRRNSAEASASARVYP